MGQWGMYDDQGDSVQDLVIVLDELTLPQYLLKKPLYETKGNVTVEYPLNIIQRNEWMARNLMKIQKNFKSIGKKYNTNFYFSGLAMHMALNWGEKLHKDLKKLPTNFPKWLKKKALHASQELLHEVTHYNAMQWTNVKQRQEALNHQIRLFS